MNTLNFDDQELTIECPDCKSPVTFTIKQVGSSINCPNCKSIITLKDEGLKNGLANIDTMVKNLFK
ncbi:hypothetical protein LF65_05688 [Clostridium beijerinckii]|uniref:30S ribosomal protein S27e n=1 Tax=Clostridium beijerinckii TaxID=1520 RepID=A0A0B5QIK9_CLOBE|nr:hypothetical protein [Clostridium beijerinckii]AJH02195.1 hypothetical protein LF65_05688 [Clostridium beijerinckii]